MLRSHRYLLAFATTPLFAALLSTGGLYFIDWLRAAPNVPDVIGKRDLRTFVHDTAKSLSWSVAVTLLLGLPGYLGLRALGRLQAGWVVAGAGACSLPLLYLAWADSGAPLGVFLPTAAFVTTLALCAGLWFCCVSGLLEQGR
jgi:hypothetical protein